MTRANCNMKGDVINPGYSDVQHSKTGGVTAKYQHEVGFIQKHSSKVHPISAVYEVCNYLQ